MRAIGVVAVALGLLVGLATPGRADTITVGLFAPSAPFPTTAARVELASRLGEHLGKAVNRDGGAGIHSLPRNKTGSGRVYARASDFAAAVKRGEVTIALVDSAYLATTGGYTVLAASVRGGEITQAWQLITRGAKKFTDLRGKRVLVPAMGGQETSFVINVLLGGIERDFFKVEAAPDSASAVAAIGLAKADAAIVPAGLELTGGATQVVALPALPTAVLVVYGTMAASQRAAIAEAAASFQGDGTIVGFRSTDVETIRGIARRFSPPVKRGPLVVPAVRLVVGDLVQERTFAIERTPVTMFAIGLARSPAPSSPAPR